MHYPEILSIEAEPTTFSYDADFTQLYALGLGCGAVPDELKFVYEKGLQALPTMAVMMGGASNAFIEQGGIDYTMIVHGEQRLTLHQPLPPAGTMISEARCLGVVDKGAGKGALVNVESTARGEDGMLYATAIMTLFCRGDGGFGGPSEDILTLDPVPDRAPDFEIAIPTLPQQAAIYRLSGDRNALHIDPEMAARAGFPGPILHGLCTYGIAGRAIMRACAGNDPARIAGLDARFSSPVYPGETVTTRIWQDGNAVAFECIVAERGVTVIRNGACRLRE
ncbi:MAG TPA: MaoC/PaaZ C-terminal domain-containing protein [Novosphingobium sp.]